MTAQEISLYTPWRYLKWAAAQTYGGVPLPREWLRVIPKSLGFQDLHAMQTKMAELSEDSCPPELREKMDRLFSPDFDKDQFFGLISVFLDDETECLLPNPFALAEPSSATHSVGWVMLSVEHQQPVLSVKHAEVTVERALQPASPSLRTICDWLATDKPLSEAIPRDALRDWLLDNDLPAEMVGNEEFLQGLVLAIERNLEDALQFGIEDNLFDMTDSGAYIADDGGGCVGIRKVTAA